MSGPGKSAAPLGASPKGNSVPGQGDAMSSAFTMPSPSASSNAGAASAQMGTGGVFWNTYHSAFTGSQASPISTSSSAPQPSPPGSAGHASFNMQHMHHSSSAPSSTNFGLDLFNYNAATFFTTTGGPAAATTPQFPAHAPASATRSSVGTPYFEESEKGDRLRRFVGATTGVGDASVDGSVSQPSTWLHSHTMGAHAGPAAAAGVAYYPLTQQLPTQYGYQAHFSISVLQSGTLPSVFGGGGQQEQFRSIYEEFAEQLPFFDFDNSRTEDLSTDEASASTQNVPATCTSSVTKNIAERERVSTNPFAAFASSRREAAESSQRTAGRDRRSEQPSRNNSVVEDLQGSAKNEDGGKGQKDVQTSPSKLSWNPFASSSDSDHVTSALPSASRVVVNPLSSTGDKPVAESQKQAVAQGHNQSASARVEGEGSTNRGDRTSAPAPSGQVTTPTSKLRPVDVVHSTSIVCHHSRDERRARFAALLKSVTLDQQSAPAVDVAAVLQKGRGRVHASNTRDTEEEEIFTKNPFSFVTAPSTFDADFDFSASPLILPETERKESESLENTPRLP
ncbi:unnamed protein product [Amoebophrya sp. A25]|nr:unnamed protein product [Amoebophrya sp. A25]|eukprot:GSA25T00000713001.1